MDISRVNLEAMFRAYNTAWQAGVAANPDPEDAGYDWLVTDFPSTTAGNFYAWLKLIPGFREWVGERQWNSVESARFQVLNRDWEDSVVIPAKDIEDDQYGVYAPIVQMKAAGWPRLRRRLAIQVLTGNATAFDGLALGHATRKYGKNTINNLSTTALSLAEFQAAFLTASAWKGEDNELLQPRFTHLVVGPKLRSTAFDIVDNEWITTGTGTGGNKKNSEYGRCKLVVWPELAGDYDDYWFLVDSSKPVKPVVFQERKRPVPMMVTDPVRVAEDGKVRFMADGRAAAAPTMPHMVFCGRVA